LAKRAPTDAEFDCRNRAGISQQNWCASHKLRFRFSCSIENLHDVAIEYSLWREERPARRFISEIRPVHFFDDANAKSRQHHFLLSKRKIFHFSQDFRQFC